jgi:hypothetical protein
MFNLILINRFKFSLMLFYFVCAAPIFSSSAVEVWSRPFVSLVLCACFSPGEGRRGLSCPVSDAPRSSSAVRSCVAVAAAAVEHGLE